MNSKERYEEMIMEMIEFDSEDIIVTSCPGDCVNNLTPVDPKNCSTNLV